MKTITVEQAKALLTEASAVIAFDNNLVNQCVINDDKSDVFLFLGWEEEGESYTLNFCAAANREIGVVGSSMFMVDTNGETQQLSLLTLWNIELALQMKHPIHE